MKAIGAIQRRRKGRLPIFLWCLVVSIAASPPVPALADAMQDILSKKSDVERTLQEIEKYAADNGGKKVPDSALKDEIERLETHLKSMDLRLESLPPCKSAPAAPSADAAIARLKGCIITPPGLPEAEKKQDELEKEIRELKKRIDYVTRVKGIADYLLTMKLFSATLGLAIEFIPSGVTAYPAGPIYDFIRVLISAGDSSMGFTQPGEVKNWKGREEYHRYLEENKDEINKEIAKRAAEKGKVDPKTGKAKISPYEVMIIGNDFTSKIAKRELDAKWKRFNDAKKEFDEAKKKREELKTGKQEREKKNRYFEGLIARLEALFRDSKWIQNPKQFEKMQSEIKVSVFDDKSGTLLTTAKAKAAPNAGSARTAGNPYEFEGVTSGSYSFTAEAPGYVKETSVLEVKTCQKYPVVIRLKKKPIIKVADIKDDEGHFLDDINVDVTALTTGASSPGSQNYRRVPLSFIVDPGAFTVTGRDPADTYETTSANVNVEAGGEADVHLVMHKKGASLVVEVWDSISNLKIDPPPGANEPSVQLEPLDSQPAPSREPYKGKGEVPFGHIAAGRYKYTARFCGWEEQTGEFSVSAEDIKSKRTLRKIFLKPTKLDSFMGNVFEHGQSEHVDGFKVVLFGLGPRKGVRFDTEEGKDPDPTVVGLHSGAFIIKGPIYSGRYKLQISRNCFETLIIDDWWVFCGIEPNARGTSSPYNFQLHLTPEFDRAQQQVRDLMKSMVDQRKKAAEAADQIVDARRKMQDLPELAQTLVRELEALKQLQQTLAQECPEADKLISDINDACKVVRDALSRIASLGETAKTSAATACELSDQAQQTPNSTKASELGNKAKELVAQAKKAADEAKKMADAHKSYESAAQQQKRLKQLEQRVSDLRKAFSASSGKLDDLRKLLAAAEQASKSLAQADAAAEEATRLLGTIRQLLKGCADDQPGKTLLENAEQAFNSVAAERQRASDEEALLKGLVRGADGVSKQANGLAGEIESVIKSCASVLGSESLVSDAKANLEKIDASSLAAQNSVKVAEECAAKAVVSAEVMVPNLALFDSVSEMKVALEHVDLKGAFVAKGKPPSKDKEFKFAGQSPGAGTKAPRGSTVSVSIYQAFEVAQASPTPTASEDVIVPSLAAFDNVSEMKVALAHAGLVGAFGAKGKPPTKELEFKFASQSPAADTKAKRGSTVTVSIYQKFEIAEATPTPATSDEVRVPSLAVFDNVSEMKVALAQSGLVGAFSAKGTPSSKEMEFKFAGQTPVAGSKVKRGSTVAVFIYQKYNGPTDESSPKSTPPPLGPGATDTMPDLIGLTLDQATTRLTSKMRIGSDDVGIKPPTPEKALTIFAQTPATGIKIDPSKEVVITVKRYGSAKSDSVERATPPAGSASPAGEVFVGTWKSTNGIVIKIDREPGGYVFTRLGTEGTSNSLFGQQLNTKGADGEIARNGVVENGALIFHSQWGRQQVKDSFTPDGDALRLDSELTDPAGKIRKHTLMYHRRK